MMACPFCGGDPFHRSDAGEALAVVCCDLGDLYFRGARPPITSDVLIEPDDFRTIGDRIQSMRGELEAYRLKFGDLEEGETRFLPCEHCEGTGQIVEAGPLPSKWQDPTPCDHEVDCEACGGGGKIEVEVAPIEADDLGDWVPS